MTTLYSFLKHADYAQCNIMYYRLWKMCLRGSRVSQNDFWTIKKNPKYSKIMKGYKSFFIYFYFWKIWKYISSPDIFLLFQIYSIFSTFSAQALPNLYLVESCWDFSAFVLGKVIWLVNMILNQSFWNALEKKKKSIKGIRTRLAYSLIIMILYLGFAKLFLSLLLG